MLRRQLSTEDFSTWSAFSATANEFRDEIDELNEQIEDLDQQIEELDDSGDTEGAAAARAEKEQKEQQRDATEAMAEELEIEAEFLAHDGGWPLGELDCDDPRYAKCRPPCKVTQRCDCEKSGPQGGGEEPSGPAKDRDPDKDKKKEKGPVDGQTAPYEDRGDQTDDETSGEAEGPEEARPAGGADHPTGGRGRSTIAPPKKKRRKKRSGGGDGGEGHRPPRPSDAGFTYAQHKFFVPPKKSDEPYEAYGIRWAKGADPCKKGSVGYILIEELYSDGRVGRLSGSSSEAARKALQTILDRLCAAKSGGSAGPSGSQSEGLAESEAKESEDQAEEGYTPIIIEDALDGVALEPISQGVKETAIAIANALNSALEATGLGAAVRAAGDLLVDPDSIKVVEMFYNDELSLSEAMVAIAVLDSPVGALFNAESAADLSQGEVKRITSELKGLGLASAAGAVVLSMVLGGRRGTKRGRRGSEGGTERPSGSRTDINDAGSEGRAPKYAKDEVRLSDDVEYIYRGGSDSPGNLTPKLPHVETPGGGLSGHLDPVEALRAGRNIDKQKLSGKVQIISPKKLRERELDVSVRPDGHTTTTAMGKDVEEANRTMQEWADSRDAMQRLTKHDRDKLHPLTLAVTDAVVGFKRIKGGEVVE